MKVWFYADGEWRRIEDPFGGEYDYFGDELEEIGFDDTYAMRFGDVYGFFVQIHEAIQGVQVDTGDGLTAADFLVLVRTPHRVYPVFVDDLPGLVGLIGELRPTIASEKEARDIDEMRSR